MDLPSDIKHLFLGWMEEEFRKQQHTGSKLALTYSRAIQSIRRCPIMIKHPDQLKDLRFIGDKMVGTMSKRLKDYCEENGYNYPAEVIIPESNENGATGGQKKKRKSAENNDEEGKSSGKPKQAKKSTRKYIPQRQTGAYAIMLALHLNDPEGDGMTKDDIIRHAAQYCSTSFVSNPSTSQFYSAWGGIKTLEKNEYVQSRGRPIYYYLTEIGTEVAEILQKVDEEEKKRQREGLGSSPLMERVVNTQTSKTSKPAKPANLTRALSGITDSTGSEQVPYTAWNSGSYEVVLVLDNREVRSRDQRDFFTEQLSALNVRNYVKALTVGDGLWIARHKETGQEAVLDFIFERKRLDDFASSIKDGRFMEQRSRLKRTGIKTVFYIVEEQMSSDVSRFSDAIQTCISMTITNSRFHVKRTKDSDATVQLIATLTRKIQKFYRERTLIVIEPRNIQSQQEYGTVLSRFRDEFPTDEPVYSLATFQMLLSKSNMVTVREMFIRMLMTIKGVSLDKAIAIQRHYKTPKNLLESYRRYSGDDKARMIHEALKDYVGNRKIGPSLSAKIYEIWGHHES